jgi:hypothetical protein
MGGLIFLASFVESGTIGQLLSFWEQAGFFSYLLPFLLIFALIFGILNQIRLFKDNKAINAIIALVVGFMSLQFPMVSEFFSEIFPRLGIGLAIILVVLILAGMFIDPKNSGIMYVMLGIGAIITIVVLVQTAGAVGWSSGSWWAENWPMIVGVVFILAVIAIIVGASSKKPAPDYRPFWPFAPGQSK